MCLFSEVDPAQAIVDQSADLTPSPVNGFFPHHADVTPGHALTDTPNAFSLWPLGALMAGPSGLPRPTTSCG